ncbi:MAG: ABC transporter permease subunit [Roseburia sp.]|nr:ABC transporter permease subunit [Roseburia sp.]
MNGRIKKIFQNIAFAAVAVGIVIAIWSIAAAVIGTELIMPSVPTVFSALGDIFKSRAFWASLGYTLLRGAIGFALSAALAFLLYFLNTVFAACAKVTEPIISALRALPTMAVTLILAIWVGGYAAPVVICVLAVTPYLYANVKARNAAVPTELKEICRLCGAGRVRTFFVLWLPHAAAGLPETLSTGFSFGVKAVIAAEILMQTADSLGQLMNLSKIYFETAMLIAFVFAAVVVTVVAEFVIRAALGAALKNFKDV